MNWVPYTGDKSYMQGMSALASGIEQAGSAFGNAFAKDQERIQMTQDKLDSLKGRLMFAQEQGLVTQAQLDEISKMPLPKAQGYMESLEAKVTRDWRTQQTQARHGGNSEKVTLPDGTVAVFGPSGKHLGNFTQDGQPVSQQTESVPVVDPITGQVVYSMPAGAKFAPQQSATSKERSGAVTLPDGTQAWFGPQGQKLGEFNADGKRVGSQPGAVPVIDPNTGETLYVMPKGAKFAPKKQDKQSGGAEKSLTESQAKNSIALQGMMAVEPDIEKSLQSYDPADRVAGDVPMLDRMKSAERKYYENTKSKWVESFLRATTGAAYSNLERSDVENMFFPTPGDSKEEATRKANLRSQMSDAILETLPSSFQEKLQAKSEARQSKSIDTGGYVPGKVYGGLRFIGGDPHVEANWQKVK